MPTTNTEASRIIDIALEYLSPDEVHELFTRLNEQVGKTSINDSVKESFSMFRSIAEDSVITVSSRIEQTKFTILWALIWSFHTFLILGNLASFIVCPFYAPWYLAFPACFAVIWVTCSPADCAITRWENSVRKRLGWSVVRGFIGHYYLKPIYKFMKKPRTIKLESFSMEIEPFHDLGTVQQNQVQ